MVCKKCRFNIEKSWKYCPNCSRNIKKERNIIVFSLITFVIIILIIISIIQNNLPMDTKYLEKSLEKKYNEKFDNIVLISTQKNSDANSGCDRSFFEIIKGKRKKVYYKVHSDKNNLDYIAYYDTFNKSKKIVDNYNVIINRKKTINELYECIIFNFGDSLSKITLSSNFKEDETSITSSKQLNSILNNSFNDETSIPIYFDSMFDDLNIYINQNILEYSKLNYNKINEINDKLISEKNTYSLSITLIFNNKSSIELDKFDGKAYVYEKYGSNQAWGETLEEFIKREEVK